MNEISIPNPDALREKAAAIVSGRDYQLKTGTSDNGWVFATILEIVEWILAPFRWLYKFSEGLPEVVRWLIVLASVTLLVLLIAHIFYTIVTSIRRPNRLRDSDLDARRRSANPVELERLADEAARRFDYITAVRFLFRASVVRLEFAEKKLNRPGTTNRELLRRYRDRPILGDSLRQLVETVDQKWYGNEDCLEIDCRACRLAYDDLCHAIKEPVDVIGA